MKKITLSLSILSALILSACSGSGHTSSAVVKKENTAIANEILAENILKNNTAEKENSPIHKDNLDLDKTILSSTDSENITHSNRDDRSILNHFHHYVSDLYTNNLINIELDNKNIELLPINENITIVSKHIHTIRDNNGELFGYYGDANISQSVIDVYNPNERKPQYSYLSLLGFDKNRTPIQPNQHIRYDGKMYYSYINIPVKSLQATVVASYNNTEKRLSMQIYDNQQDLYLELRDSRYYNKKDVAVLDNVDKQHIDNISGKLYNKNNQFVAEFSGGIYGNIGEILVGKTKSREEQGNDAWKGIIGATGKEFK